MTTFVERSRSRQRRAQARLVVSRIDGISPAAAVTGATAQNRRALDLFLSIGSGQQLAQPHSEKVSVLASSRLMVRRLDLAHPMIRRMPVVD
jgi:hypothetical protein